MGERILFSMSRHSSLEDRSNPALPPSIGAYVPAEHSAHLVVALVRESLDLSGRPARPNAVRSEDDGSAAALWLLLGALFLAADREGGSIALDAPDFRTIADFRQRHLTALTDLFVQVLKLAEKAGLVKLGHVPLHRLAPPREPSRTEKQCTHLRISSTFCARNMNTSPLPLDVLRQTIIASIAVKQALLADQPLLESIVRVGDLMVKSFREGNRVIFAGNGGSAADAQHLAAEFVSRFEFDRPGLPSLSLSTDTSMITAIGNDYGYEKLFRRQLEAQARPGDLFVGITTSGRSKNVLAAFDACKSLRVTSVALCGLAGEFNSTVDHVLRAPSMHTPRIQECHVLMGHMLCAHVETAIFGHLAPQ